MKTKNIFLSAVVAAATVAVSSCSLDYDPIDTYSDVTQGVTEEQEEVVFSTKADVISAIDGLYTKIHDRQEHWYLDNRLIAECHSDNAYVGTTGAEVVPYEDNSIEGSNSVVERDWDRFLADAATATKIITNLDKVQDGSLSVSEQNRYRAEAEIFRAMIWFDMVRMWGDIPCIRTTAGNITADNVGEMYDAYFPEQMPEEEVYQNIEMDLLDALQYAPDKTGDKTLFSKDVARALLAKVYAEKPIRDYSKTIKYVDELIANGYDLVDDYSLLYGIDGAAKDGYNATPLASNTIESILEVHYVVGSGNWASWMFGRCLENWDESFTWAKWVTPSRDLCKAFTDAGDTKRYEESVVWYECAWSNYYPSDNYAFMYKCRSGYVNWIKYRMGDLLLLKAEALINGTTPDLEAAATIIDKVRARVGLAKLPSSTRSSKDAMLNALLLERRLELAFEGERWFDLVRLDKVEEVMNAVYAKDSGRLAQRNAFTQNSYRLPIPQAAIDQNDKLIQNPGY